MRPLMAGPSHCISAQGVTWSDGTPFTSADVLFTLRAVFDPRSESVVANQLTVAGKPITATAPDDHTIVLTYPAASGPGLRLLDALVILPKHKLEGALAAGTFAKSWDSATPPAEIVGTGPFVLREYVPGAADGPRPQPALLAQGRRRNPAPVSRSHRPAGRARPGRRAAAAAVGRHRPDAERAAARRLRGGTPRGRSRHI